MLAVCAAGLQARTAMDFFRATGADRAFGQLQQAVRMDMADYYESGLRHVVDNVYEGKAVIVDADSLSLHMRPGGMTDVSMHVLVNPAKADTTLMVIETALMPQPDSRIMFFDKDWNTLKRDPLTAPVLSGWLTEQGKRHRREVQDWLPFMLAQASYDPATGTLTVSHSMMEYYPDNADRKKLELYIRPQLTYYWRGGKFSDKKR